MVRTMKCRTPRCRGRTSKSQHSPYCPACRAQRWKERSPVGYHFNKLKFRAKERGHAFTLTRARFEFLWLSGLSQNHGKHKFALSIDRIKNDEGYHDSNVRLLTLSQNARRNFVPFFKNKADEEAAIAETAKQIAEAYPELSECRD